MTATRGTRQSTPANPETSLLGSASRRLLPSPSGVSSKIFMKELVRHDFRRLLQRFDQQNLAAQRRLGVDDEQYLREALIPYWSRARVDEAPADEDAPRFTSGDLRRVQGVLIDRVDNLDSHRERYRVSGMLELSGSVRFVFQLEVRRIGERYVADPPVG